MCTWRAGWARGGVEMSLEKKVGASGHTGGGMDQSGVSLGMWHEHLYMVL